MSDALHTNMHRYPGVKPFTVSEDYLFFGRDSDINALQSLLVVKDTVVLYGKSGYGKSSLINAGIIPRLQVNYFSIRFNNFSLKDEGENLSPLQTTLKRLSEKPTDDNFLKQLLTDKNSLWYCIKQYQWGKKIPFIIFFDQFEELFTYPKEQQDAFAEQLSALLYSTVPTQIKKIIADLPAGAISETDYASLFDKPNVKIVFSIRSDRLSLLNLLKDKIPTILESCYELDAIHEADAKKAIVMPAKLPQVLGFPTPDFIYDDEAVDVLLEYCANPIDKKIDAATLQILCRHIEDKVVAQSKVYTITAALLGNISDIFEQYYTGVLDKLNADEKAQAQKLIEDELIDGDKRNPLSEHYIKTKFKVSAHLLGVLENSSLLRKERDARGTILYEVSHDSLIGAINRIGEKRRQIENEKAQQDLQKKFETEQQRNDVLEKLNTKVNTRLKQVRLSLIMAVIATVAAVFLAVYSDRKKNEAEAAKNVAEEATNKERESSYLSKKAWANFYVERGDKYFYDPNFKDNSIKRSAAKLNFDSALLILKDYRNDPLYKEINDKIDSCNQD